VALDYSMTKDALNSAVLNELTRAQMVGESAGALGFLGADAFTRSGGILDMLRGRSNPFTQESIGDVGPGGYPSSQNSSIDYGGSSEETPGGVKGLLNSLYSTQPTTRTSIKDEATITTPGQKYNQMSQDNMPQVVPGMDMMYGDPVTGLNTGAMPDIMPQKITSEIPSDEDGMGGSIGSVNPDGSYEFVFRDGTIQTFQQGEKPIKAGGPIAASLSNNQGANSVSTGPNTSASEVNQPTNNPLIDLLNRGKKGIQNVNQFRQRLGGNLFGDNLSPFDPYYKDNYYDLEFDENEKLIGDMDMNSPLYNKYAGKTKETLNSMYPTYGWTTEARGF